VDHFLSEYGLFLACTLQCVLLGWVARASHLREYVNHLSVWRVGRWWEWSIRYLIPAVLVVLLVTGVVGEFRRPYGDYPWLAVLLIGRDWLVLTLVAALFVAARPWRTTPEREGRAG
jgi:NSS family neurotransmitter:Na+ symporter